MTTTVAPPTPFEQFQQLRKRGEAELREQFAGWVLSKAPSDMTMEEFRSLFIIALTIHNKTALAAYNLGESPERD